MRLVSSSQRVVLKKALNHPDRTRTREAASFRRRCWVCLAASVQQSGHQTIRSSLLIQLNAVDTEELRR